MLEWLQDNETLLGWLAASSLILFIGTLIALPFLIVRIPTDYLSPKRQSKPLLDIRNPALKTLAYILKNTIGFILFTAGILMLILPGQGILTIIVGLILMNFPGKQRFLRWLVTRGKILRSINWIRRRAGHPPIEIGTDTR